MEYDTNYSESNPWTNGKYLAIATGAGAVSTVILVLAGVFGSSASGGSEQQRAGPSLVASQNVIVEASPSASSSVTDEAAALPKSGSLGRSGAPRQTTSASEGTGNREAARSSDVPVPVQPVLQSGRAESDVSDTAPAVQNVRDNLGVIAREVGNVTINNNPGSHQGDPDE
jgi:hypothetical protein